METRVLDWDGASHPEERASASIAQVVLISLVAFCFAKLPSLIAGIDATKYYLNDAPLIGILPLAVYLAARQRPPLRIGVATVLAAALATLLANGLPVSDSGPIVMTRMHLPIALWAVPALVFIGGAPRAAAARVAFACLTGDLILLTALLLTGGVVVSFTTVWIFHTAGVDISGWYFSNVVVWGLVTAPLVAAHLVAGPRPVSLVGRIALPFLPLVLLTLIAYLAVLSRTGWAAFEERDFLANLNAILVGVAFLSLAVVCDGTRRAERRGTDVLNLALIAVTLAIDGLALWAIARRLLSAGFDSVRFTVLGTDAVVLGLFAGMLWHYVRFAAGRAPLAEVTEWIARYLPVLPCWALLVSVLLPQAPI